MATCARRDETAVIDPGTRKGHGALVTGLTWGIGDDVARWLPGCEPAVMTAGAVREDSGVVHTSAGERHRAPVAVLARSVGSDVVWRLAERGNAVMAGRASARDARVTRLRIGCKFIW